MPLYNVAFKTPDSQSSKSGSIPGYSTVNQAVIHSWSLMETAEVTGKAATERRQTQPSNDEGTVTPRRHLGVAGPTFFPTHLPFRHTGYDITIATSGRTLLRIKPAENPWSRISWERFNPGSPNFTMLSETIVLTPMLGMTSPATSPML